MIVRWSEGRLPGRAARGACEFEHAGRRYVIPAMYRFARGIVFDALSPLDAHARGGIREPDEPIEPLFGLPEELPIEEIDAERMGPARAWSMTRAVFAPGEMPEPTFSRFERVYRALLGGAPSFSCDRFYASFGEGEASMPARVARFLWPLPLPRVRLALGAVTRVLPVARSLELPARFEGVRALHFKHPRTQTRHALYFQNPDIQTSELPMPIARRLRFARLEYEIDPALPEGESPRMDSRLATDDALEDALTGVHAGPASAIGVIGGADGPTAIFLGDHGEARTGARGLPLHACTGVVGASGESIRVALLGIEGPVCAPKFVTWERAR